MKIALFGRTFDHDYINEIQFLINELEKKDCTILIHEPFYKFISPFVRYAKEPLLFNNHDDLDKGTFCLISIGGDGTLLDTLTLIRDSGIPVFGINTGRLGFLSAISTSEIHLAIQAILERKFEIEARSVIELTTSSQMFSPFNFALNELTVLKRDNSTMITISAYINEKYLSTYWADGLIIATPTGSTGYSLSCGGPIIAPESQNFVITPISSHNLTVRPIVVPDNASVKLKVEGRIQEFLVYLDSRALPMDTSIELTVTKGNFCFNLIRLENSNFFKTIRNKLAWGLDKRN